MTAASAPYTPSALAELSERTEYEAWLLEAVHKIVDQQLAVEPSPVDDIVYPPNGGPHVHHGFITSNILIGDWKPEFLKAGAPLVFVTAFKLIDMLMEWVLIQNCVASTYKFQQKIAALKGSVHFPPQIETRVWLRDRLLALYEQLEPLRGTIIHDRHFKSAGGTLQVSASKGGTIGPEVAIAGGDLRNLALVFVSLLRYIEGTWTIDIFGEKRLGHTLDQLAHLHKLPLMGQLEPRFLTVRLYVPDVDPIEIDVSRIRRDIADKRKNQDVMFDVRIVAVPQDGAEAIAYVIRWAELQSSGPYLTKTRAELATCAVALPADVDTAAVAREMGLHPQIKE